jgi:hypothetical protein
MDLGNRFFVYSLTFYFIPVNHYRYHATDRGKPNTRVTSRKVDGCVGRNLLTSGIRVSGSNGTKNSVKVFSFVDSFDSSDVK